MAGAGAVIDLVAHEAAFRPSKRRRNNNQGIEREVVELSDGDDVPAALANSRAPAPLSIQGVAAPEPPLRIDGNQDAQPGAHHHKRLREDLEGEEEAAADKHKEVAGAGSQGAGRPARVRLRFLAPSAPPLLQPQALPAGEHKSAPSSSTEAPSAAIGNRSGPTVADHSVQGNHNPSTHSTAQDTAHPLGHGHGERRTMRLPQPLQASSNSPVLLPAPRRRHMPAQLDGAAGGNQRQHVPSERDRDSANNGVVNDDDNELRMDMPRGIGHRATLRAGAQRAGHDAASGPQSTGNQQQDQALGAHRQPFSVRMLRPHAVRVREVLNLESPEQGPAPVQGTSQASPAAGGAADAAAQRQQQREDLLQRRLQLREQRQQQMVARRQMLQQQRAAQQQQQQQAAVGGAGRAGAGAGQGGAAEEDDEALALRLQAEEDRLMAEQVARRLQEDEADRRLRARLDALEALEEEMLRRPQGRGYPEPHQARGLPQRSPGHRRADARAGRGRYWGAAISSDDDSDDDERLMREAGAAAGAAAAAERQRQAGARGGRQGGAEERGGGAAARGGRSMQDMFEMLSAMGRGMPAGLAAALFGGRPERGEDDDDDDNEAEGERGGAHRAGRQRGGGPRMLPPFLAQQHRNSLMGFMRVRDTLSQAARLGLPPQLLLSDRDFTADDYEMLCRLDEGVENRKGASEEAIGAMSTQVVTSEWLQRESAAHPDAAPRCTICLEDLAVGDTLRVAPCSHKAHQACLDAWLKQKAQCPVCMQPCK